MSSLLITDVAVLASEQSPRYDVGATSDGPDAAFSGIVSGVTTAARCSVVVDLLAGFCDVERVRVATAALSGLTPGARLHATTDALADVGGDEVTRAVGCAAAEQTLAHAADDVRVQAVERLSDRLDEPARLRLAGRLLDGIRHEQRAELMAGYADDEGTGGRTPDTTTTAGGDAAPPVSRDDVVDSGAALRLAGELVDRVAEETLSGAVDDEALRGSVATLVVLGRKVDAERLRRVGEINDRGAHGSRSTADMLRERYGISCGSARSQVRTARRLRRLPGTARRLREGSLDLSHAEQAGKALDEVDDATRRGALTEQDGARLAGLVDDLAAGSDPTEDAGRLGRRLDELANAHGGGDLDERDRRAQRKRRLWMGPSTRPGEQGMTAVEGALPPAAAQVLGAALERLAKPTGPRDDRSVLQRRADALVQLADTVADATCVSPVDRGEGEPDEPAEATAIPHPPAGTGRATAASQARVLLLTTIAALQGRDGGAPAWLDGYGAVGSEAARQICCDAEFTLVTVDESGQPLNVGRAQRSPNDAQRAAVIARDRSCVGCDAPARRCQVHHVAWWKRDRGRTDLANLCLLCPSCHTNVHHFGWEVRRTADGTYTAGACARPPPAAPSG